MKRKNIVVAVLLAFCSVGALYAQNWGIGGKNLSRNTVVVEKMTLKGSLALQNGRIALVSDGKTYYVQGIQRLIGFVDAVKEGANVEIEGSVQTLQRQTSSGSTEDYLVLFAEKLTAGGKTYDNLSPRIASQQNMPHMPNMQQFPPMMRQRRG